MKTVTRKLTPKKPPQKENRSQFGWYGECVKFLNTHNAYSIHTLDDSRIYLVDQFLKMTMDGLKTNNADMLRETTESPLLLIFYMLGQILESTWKKGWMPIEFLLLLSNRVQEDLILTHQFKAGGIEKSIAAQKLRQRGLLSCKTEGR